MKLFLSYHFDPERPHHEHFVFLLSYHLRRQRGLEAYCYADDPARSDWRRFVGPRAVSCDAFILIAGRELGDVQRQEALAFVSAASASSARSMALVELPGYSQGVLPGELFQYLPNRCTVPDIPADDPAPAAYTCAKTLTRLLLKATGDERDWWVAADGLPLGYPYDYEKALIDDYVDGNGRLLVPARIEHGAPLGWPDVEKDPFEGESHDNPIDVESIGRYRPEDHRVIVDGRAGSRPAGPLLTLPEAGPRATLRYPVGGELTVAVLVSGGIAPGINAVIDGIVERHLRYWRESEESRTTYNLQIVLYRDGFSGLLGGHLRYLHYEGRKLLLVPATDSGDVRQEATRGGASAGTSRHDALLDLKDPVRRNQRLRKVVERLSNDKIDILYVIGGDGSMRAAHAIWSRCRELQSPKDLHPLSVVAIPKTMDNDILWVWQSFGFLSAVERAKEAVLQLHTEVTSNPRLCVIQLFGSDSGFVVSHTALASSVCDAALIPEVSFTLHGLSAYVRRRLGERLTSGKSPGGLILLAETAIPQDVEDYIDSEKYALGLGGTERDAICEFIGSSLLTASDIQDWPGLFERLRGSAQADGVLGRLWERLTPEVRGLVAQDWDSLRDKPSVGRLVLQGLSNALREWELHDGLDIAATGQKDQHALLTAVGQLRAARTDDREDREARVRTLLERAGLPLNYDAKRLLLDLARPETSVKVTPAGLDRLSRRLVETVNRGLLEQALGERFLRPVESRSSAHRDRRVHGQTPDELRRGGLKVISGVLQADIRDKALMPNQYWRDYRVFTNEPRHLLRAIPPSVTDVIFGHRLGTLAVDNAMAGYTDFMVSQWLTEYVLVPLQLVVLGRKRVRQDGIFWKSVLANTGQPPNM